jgi:Ca2+-binding RTX toxin-like protein
MPLSAPRIPITVLAGQSNANSTPLAVEVFRATANAGGMMVHVAMNGSALAATAGTDAGHWNAPGPNTPMGENLAILFAQLVSILDPASPSHVPGAFLDNIIFVQGEADTYGNYAARNYGENLRAFHAALTARFGVHDLILAGLSDVPDDHRDMSPSYSANWQIIQQHQRAVAAALGSVRLVDPDAVAAGAGYAPADMFRDDFLHYDESSGFATLLGRRLVRDAIGDSSPANTGATSPSHIGTHGDDLFQLTVPRFAQVLAGPGHDRAVIASTANLMVIEATNASTRILDKSGAQPRILDLIRLESLTLGSGDDRVRLAGGVTTLDTRAGNDVVTGSTRAEDIHLGYGRDRALGGANADKLHGGLGNDTLYGQDGRDWLHGGRSADMIFGGNGHDRILGGQGNDLLQGGTGADRFVFSVATDHDRIADFEPHHDRLVLQNMDYGDLTFHQQGQDLIISFGDFRLVLDDTTRQDLPRSDLIFV